MNIVVCVKQVPDTTAEKKLDANNRLDRKSVENILNPFDEYAVEEALRLKEKHGGTVTALCVGPESAKEAIRKAVAMGVDKGALVSDAAMAGSDALATAFVLSQALKKVEHDIIIFGMQSTDALTAIVPAAVSQFLGIPHHGYTNKITVGDGEVACNRASDAGYDVVVSKLPAAVSVTKAINEPRYASLRGIMQSRKAEITTFSLADLGIDPSTVGAGAAQTKVLSYIKPAPRQAGTVVKDDGQAAVQVAEFLVLRKII